MKDRRIFFLATDNNIPSGGRLFIYRLVDILVKNGYNAYALHQRRNFSYTWFQNKTPVCYTYQIKKTRRRTGLVKHLGRLYLEILKDKIATISKSTSAVTITKNDIVVLPETRMSFFKEILPGVPKIILSQNPYLLLGCGDLSDMYCTDLRAVITMSILNYNMHYFAFQNDSVWNVPLSIDHELYNYSEIKKRQIAYMPRRLPKDSIALINMLNLRGNLHDFRFVPIDRMSQSSTCRVLKDSLIFLSFSHREGFGLPPAEAMACGCIVIGYSGNGGEEFFNEDTYKISDGDLITYAETVENVIEQYVTAPESLNNMRKKASEHILRKYSQEQSEKDFLKAWYAIMDKPIK